MKCPNCGAALADDNLKCASCGTEYELVESTGAGDPDAELVCVANIDSFSEYEVIASLLDAEGVPVALHNAVGMALRGLADGPFSWDPAYRAVRVMVPREYEEQARGLIAAQLPAGEDPVEDETPTS